MDKKVTMDKKERGLSDYDKITVTFTLWLAFSALFATAFTLPALPDNVTTFLSAANDVGVYHSKYNNLFLLIVTAISVAIVLPFAELKRSGRLERNFTPIMAFCSVLFAFSGGIIIYAMFMQYEASVTVSLRAVHSIDIHRLIVTVAGFLLSMASAVMPLLIRTAEYRFRLHGAATANAERFWALGAYGYLVISAGCVFIPSYYCYIPLAAAFVTYVLFILCYKKDNQI